MKANFGTRVLSVVLCTVMLFSCWVFTAPSAEAANNTTAGTYDVYITFDVTDTADPLWGIGGDGYGSGYTYDNKTAGDRVGITVFHKNNNGWGSTESHTDFDLYPSSGTKPIKVSGEQNTGTTFFGIGFPTSIYAYNDHGNAVDGTNYKITKVQIKKAGAATSTYQTIFEGNLVAGASNTGIKYCWLKSDGTHTQDGGSVEDNKGWTAKFPYVASGGTLTRSADITLDGTNDQTSLITKAVATDQYGVTYAAANCTLSRTCSYSSSAITIDGNNLKATASAHISTTNVNSQNVTVTGTWAGSKSVSKTVKVKITDETYPSYWKYYVTNPSDLDNPTLETETVDVYYGDEYNCQNNNAYVYVPSVTDNYYTTAKHYTGGTFTTDSNISKWSKSDNSGTIITMGYTESNHSFTDHYEEISGNHTVHRAYCSCGYSKIDDVQSQHVYSDWVEVDGTNHNRTCSKCNHVQTENHEWTNWSSKLPASGESDLKDSIRAELIKRDFVDDSTCYRYCTTCGYLFIDTGHKYTDDEHAPTCTDDGYIVHTCSDCGYSYKEYPYTESGDTDYKALGHDIKDVALSSDAEGHYKVCKVCHENIKSDGTIGKDTHTNTRAVRTEATIKTRPTCTEAGEYYFTCSECGRIDNEYYTVDDDGEGKALGHDFQIVKPEPTDGGTACVIYYDCSRCDVCSAQKYDESTGEYVADEARTFTDAQEAESELGNDESLKVQAPSFNTSDATAFYEGAVPYINRPSQMRLTDKNNADGTKTNQTVRFVGSVKIPSGVNYKVNLNDDADDVVIDFGFVWTQTKYITVNDQGETDYQTGTNVVVKRPVEGKENQYKLYDIPIGEKEDNDIVLYSYETYGTKDPSKLVSGGNMIQTMSVVAKNKKTGDTIPEMNADASNWTGCTHWTANEGRDHYYTFNLVVSIKPGNWGKEYCARPYITYKYHGQTYTVYDAGTSNTDDDGRKYNHESVVSLATKIMAKNYLALGAANKATTFSIRAVLNADGLSQIDSIEKYKNYVLGSYKRDKEYVEDKVIFGQTKDDNKYLIKQKSTPTGSGSRQVYEWIDSSLVIDDYLITTWK